MDIEQDSIDILRQVVIETRGLHAKYTEIMPKVTATVNGVTVIEDEEIKTTISIDHTMGTAKIGIFWEDYGYEEYRSMGLFGLMGTGYHNIIDTGDNTFRIVDKSYIIDVNYNNCTNKL